MPRPVLRPGRSQRRRQELDWRLPARAAGPDLVQPRYIRARARRRVGLRPGEANACAWTESVRRLDEAVAAGHSYAFETTLGGRTVAARIAEATWTHDVIIWFRGSGVARTCMWRVRARVAAGGHDIPEVRIRARYPQELQNLIALMPRLAHLQVYDNSTEADIGCRSRSRARAGNAERPPGVAGPRRRRDAAPDTGLGEAAGGGGAHGLNRSARGVGACV